VVATGAKQPLSKLIPSLLVVGTPACPYQSALVLVLLKADNHYWWSYIQRKVVIKKVCPKPLPNARYLHLMK